MAEPQLNSTENWSESVEDLVAAGDNDAAISLLESVVSALEAAGDSASGQLASAIADLAGLYSSRGFSLKADHLRSRASLVRHRLLDPHSLRAEDSKEEKPRDLPVSDESFGDGNFENSADNDNPEDDWEAIADRSPDKLLSSQCSPGVSELSLEDTKAKTPKRRGRGTFSYKKKELYSDHLSDNSVGDKIEDEDVSHGSERNTKISHTTYGTRHVLLLADFSPSTKTIDLEKLFEDYRDRGVVIRWINDTTALAVFGTPSIVYEPEEELQGCRGIILRNMVLKQNYGSDWILIALQAKNRVTCPFKVRVLDEDDELLSSISTKDLEPPRQRPKTSARAAQRMIAQSMGLKLPSTSFGSRELRKQEDNRRNRIVTRQKLKDNAWGDDE